ncbi:RNA polymerase II CTD phosphatase Fcp1 [Pseudohyphozyma bogoriensis]|nr:RNA polymerase II CTD phosphatase Fcp1 [Pseudohyphozyma bogoriensis]
MEEQPPTPIYLPRALPYPLTVNRLFATPTSTVRKTQQLFSYSYFATGEDGHREKQIRVYESPVGGQVKSWAVREGDVVRTPDDPILTILEPCTHAVQLHGLCALCGKDLTAVDYTGFSDTSRAEISMVHDSGGLTVSLSEAHRLETQTTQRLLSSRKLSLIVDLDQTIVHATVDPTVGEWLEDPKNPNYPALEGTEKFRLGEAEGAGEDDGCYYYLKMRPGLKKFLEDVAKIYEMHVYTMGTRAYAIEVCKVIDPGGGLFGGRILSRDESGSLTRKSLQRLFPCDTNMVVIIDDRADVWDGSPNLVKVVPYEFFVGIGDINAAFLPKKKELTGASGPSSKEADSEKVKTADIDVDPEGAIASLDEAEASTAVTIHDQIEDRPLSKMEEEMEEVGEAVLKNDDVELVRVYDILKSVRDKFFADVDRKTTADVKSIIPHMKRQVLKGVDLVFSGVVALGARPEDSEHWKAATSFGAKCGKDISDRTTHVVANQVDLDDDVGFPMADLDWAAAANEVDDFLNETDDDDEGGGGDASETDGAESDASNGSSRGAPRKRARISTDSEGEDVGKGKEIGSPLQKRKKSARDRKSKLKVSFPAEELGEEAEKEKEDEDTSSSDDEDFLASMAREVEKGWS